MSTNPILRTASKYATEYGWRLIPIAHGTKDQPLIKGGDGWKRASRNPSKLDTWWQKWPDANPAVRGDSKHGPIIVDVEGPLKVGEARYKAAMAYVDNWKLPNTLMVQTPSGGLHIYFAPDGKPFPRKIKPIGPDGAKLDIDLLGDKGYALLPPSVVSDYGGGEYSVVNDAPLAPLPKGVRADFEKAAPASSNGTGSTKNGDRIDLRKKKMPDVIPEGERDTTLTSLAGSARRRGASEEGIRALLSVENKLRCEIPLPEQQVAKIAHSIAKKDPDDVAAAVKELNRTWAAVSMGGKMRYIEEKADGTIEFWSRREFIAKLENRFIWVPKGVNGELVRRPLSKTWLEEEGRRECDDLVFDPGAPKGEKVYNLWRGFAVEPSEDGSCDLFLAHVYENVCKGRQSRYDWLLGWFAQLIQDPSHKVSTAVVLRGPQGVGKSIVGKTVGRLLGPHYFTASSPRYVTGRFNSHLERVLLLHAEEAFWAGDKAAEGVLKDLITNDTQAIEQKGLEPFLVANHLRLLVTGNQKWLVPAGVSDRRFAVFDVSNARQQDTAYFSAMLKQLGAGGYAKLLHTLQHHPYDETMLRRVPKTAERREQIEESLLPEEKWLLDLLTTGQLRGAHQRGDRVKVAIEQLHAEYVEHARSSGVSHRASVTAFGMWLRKWFPSRRSEPIPTLRVYGTQRRAIWLPSLATARARYDERIGKRRWEKPLRWQVGEL